MPRNLLGGARRLLSPRLAETIASPQSQPGTLRLPSAWRRVLWLPCGATAVPSQLRLPTRDAEC